MSIAVHPVATDAPDFGPSRWRTPTWTCSSQSTPWRPTPLTSDLPDGGPPGAQYAIRGNLDEAGTLADPRHDRNAEEVDDLQQVLGGGRVVVVKLEVEHDVGAMFERVVAQFVQQLAGTEVVQRQISATSFTPDRDMGWVYPRIGLGRVGLDWVEYFFW